MSIAATLSTNQIWSLVLAVFAALALFAFLGQTIGILVDLLETINEKKEKEIRQYSNILTIQLAVSIAIDLSFLFFSFILGYSSYMLLIGDDKVPEIWINILINIGTSIFFSVGTSLFVYYKFLKRLPEESKNQIEELLNKRLNYETTNHNATLQNSNSNRESLSKEHINLLNKIDDMERRLSDIKSTVKDVSSRFDIEKAIKEEQYSSLNKNATDIVDSISNLSTFGEAFEKINLENIRLKDENLKLTSENQRLREWIDNVKLSVPPISPHL